MKALWNNTVIAESDSTIVIEENHYFPKGSVHTEYLKESDHTTVCPWKGTDSYFTVEVDGVSNENAAWTYHEPKEKAVEIKDCVAFWNGVEVTE